MQSRFILDRLRGIHDRFLVVQKCLCYGGIAEDRTNVKRSLLFRIGVVDACIGLVDGEKEIDEFLLPIVAFVLRNVVPDVSSMLVFHLSNVFVLK